MYHNAATGRLSTAVGSTHQTVSEICSRTDAHTQRDMLITILRFPTKVSIGICSGGECSTTRAHSPADTNRQHATDGIQNGERGDRGPLLQAPKPSTCQLLAILRPYGCWPCFTITTQRLNVRQMATTTITKHHVRRTYS